MNYLSIDDILEIHRQLVTEFGGTQGIRDIGRVESVVASQSQEVFGEQVYTTVYEKAGAIMRGIIQDHPFTDGNKRTGVVSAISFLAWNGYKLSFKRGELEDFAVKVAIDTIDVDHIASWLENHCR